MEEAGAVPAIGSDADLKRVIKKMREGFYPSFYLGGSRKKAPGGGYAILDRSVDWDWNVDIKNTPWLDNIPLQNPLVFTPIQQFIAEEFEWVEKDWKYTDNQFAGLYRHRLFPHITLIVRRDLDLYKRVFDKIPKAYWQSYFWKSNPETKERMKDKEYKKEWYIRGIATFNMLYEVAKYPTIEECF
jgi:hypothetical protein